MNCREIRDMTIEYVLGGLGPAARLCVEVHTAHCPACRQELEDACELAAVCERALSHPHPVDDFESVMARIVRCEARIRETPVYRRLTWRRFAARAATAAAAAALLAIALPAARNAGRVVEGIERATDIRALAADPDAEGPVTGGPIARRIFEIERAFASLSTAHARELPDIARP
ncbi:MAG: zf-HC2 domain-containing protein [Candidatus Hydrogenedentes bacterium]|nr:zf-HC2 domain-containing protein [Candidatus Hydrogenedentota bacterium]